jgi:hypothetical protein
MLPAKRTWSVAQASGSDSYNLPVLSLDSFGIVASFVGRTELRAMSCANRAAFDLLQGTRVRWRKEQEDALTREWQEEYDRDAMINRNFDDMPARMQYYNCIESFTYQFLLGQLILDPNADEFERTLLHGPVLEHLLTLCGSDVQLARNVVDNYYHLYNTTWILGTGIGTEDHDGWITGHPGLRLDDHMMPGRRARDETRLEECFCDYFAKSNFPELGVREYVEYLIRECEPVFELIQCTLSLRMRSEEGKCELGACENLLQDMHMTSTREEFCAHLRTFHLAAVRKLVEEGTDVSYDPDITAEEGGEYDSAAGYDSEGNYDEELERKEYKRWARTKWYADVTPCGIYHQYPDHTYADFGDFGDHTYEDTT